MKLYRYWTSETTRITVDGEPLDIHCYGHSNDSIEAARNNARDQAAAVQRKIEGERRAADTYHVAIREEVIEVLDEHNIVSRNRYGALVLNSENVVVIDIDDPKTNWWQRLFGRRHGTKKEQILDMIAKRVTHDDYAQLGFRAYETRAGMRLIVTGREIPPGSKESRKLLRAFNSDPLYATLCVKQECYRARLTPKPYRMRLKAHRISYPRDAREQSTTEQWIAGYEKASEAFATCAFVKAFGKQTRSSIVDYHDRISRAHEALRLA